MVDMFEDGVDRLVLAPAFPPAFDHATVVAVDLVTVAVAADCE